MKKNPRQKSEKHLDFIRELPCCVCLNPIQTEACHIRFSDAMAGTLNPGGAKSHDFFTVPMCGKCHRRQHAGSEPGFWKSVGINPHYLALVLHSVSGNHDIGRMVVVAHKQMAHDYID